LKIGLTYDLKTAVEVRPGAPEDETEECDPPDTIDALVSEIERLGHTVVRLGGGREFLNSVINEKVDFVFNISEGRGTYRSREAQVPSVLEMLRIPYAGADPLTLALCLDKPLTKTVAESLGIRTPRYAVLSYDQEIDLAEVRHLNFPLVAKPAYEGSSKGIRLTSKVERIEELAQAIVDIHKMYRQPALVEEFIAGKEITVGIIGNRPPRVVGVMEVVPRNGAGDGFMYTLEVKRDWQRLVLYRCPAHLPPQTFKVIEGMALALHKGLQCRDMARFDFRVDAENRPYFLEVNPLPGLSPVYSDLPIMAGLMGQSYNQLIGDILEAALERCELVGVK
jgi:D-alanine-D-alanine ligase